MCRDCHRDKWFILQPRTTARHSVCFSNRNNGATGNDNKEIYNCTQSEYKKLNSTISVAASLESYERGDLTEPGFS
jgi:hypothetical protein